MTPRISLVAVCCSNDSFSSWNSRTFSMAITAWSAKVSSSLICAGVNGAPRMSTSAEMSNNFRPADEEERPRRCGSCRTEIRKLTSACALTSGICECALLAHPVKSGSSILICTRVIWIRTKMARGES